MSEPTPMTTPNFTPDVPQWCNRAANEIRNTPSRELSANNIANIIARHAPQPEATPATNTAGETCCEWAHVSCNDFVEGVDKLIEDCEDGTVIIERPTAPAATDAGEVQATTPKPEKPKTVLKKEGESFRPVEREANLSTVQVERMLAESWKIIKNAEATTKWPRYAKSEFGTIYMQRIEGDDWISVKKSDHPSSAEAGTSERCDLVRGLLQCKIWRETDADGNALPDMKTWNASMQNIADGNTKSVQEVIDALPQQQASGVERYDNHAPGGMVQQPSGHWIKAADYDAAIAAKDATIKRLRAEVERLKQWELDAWRVVGNLEDAAEGRPVEVEDGKSPHPTIKTIAALRTRAEAAEAEVAELKERQERTRQDWLMEREERQAAEAKCAELEKEVNFNFSLMKKCDAELREKSETLERIDNLVMRGDAKCVVEEVRRVCSELGQARAQIAAANERVAALEKERDGLREQVYELKNGERP